MRTPMIALLAAALFLNACSSVQTKGKPFYAAKPETNLTNINDVEFRNLDKTLQEGTVGEKKGTLKADMMRTMIPGNPKITVTKDSERWLYEYSEVTDIIKVNFSGMKGSSVAREEALELIFDKNLILTDYIIRPDPYYAVRVGIKTKWGFIVLRGLLFGSAAGIAARAVFK